MTVRFPVSQLSSLSPQLNKAASQLTVNPFDSQARHFPYIALMRRHRGRHYVFAFRLTVKRGIIHRDRETLLCFGNQVVVVDAGAFVFEAWNLFELQLFHRQCKSQTTKIIGR